MRFTESLEYALLKGKSVKEVKKNIAAKIWSDSKEDTREVSCSNIFRGKTQQFSELSIKSICEETGVDANFLFNVKPMERAL